MTEPSSIFLALAAGLGIGLLFYGGLWVTVSRIHSVAHPALLIATSFVLRMSVALAGIWFVSAGDIPRVASCLAGFLCGRWIVVRLTRPRAET